MAQEVRLNFRRESVLKPLDTSDDCLHLWEPLPNRKSLAVTLYRAGLVINPSTSLLQPSGMSSMKYCTSFASLSNHG